MVWRVSKIGLGRSWGVVMVILISCLYCINVIRHIRYCNKWCSVHVRYDKYTVLRPIINAPGNNVNRLWERVKKDMGINGGGWYIRCNGCDGWSGKMILTVLLVWCGVICVFYRSIRVRWVMCMGRSVREDPIYQPLR